MQSATVSSSSTVPEFVNELDIKECVLVQATGRCCTLCWFNEWYTRISGIEGQVNECWLRLLLN